MNHTSFSEYSTKQVHFLDETEEVPALIKLGLSLINHSNSTTRVVDLGCGDGRLLFALHKNRLLKQVTEVVGVDISETRVKRLKKMLPFVRGIISNALNVEELSSSSFDFIICSQLIEHLDDKLLLLEIKRLLSKRGVAYISTVTKKWYGMYFYFRDGAFRLDPTHVREYTSSNEFINLVSSSSFDIMEVKSENVMFPLLDLIIRFFIKFGIAQPGTNFYMNHKLQKARKFKIPVIGYNFLEVLVKQK